MRKIRLSDTDLELFDLEISPSDYNFYQKHKDAFRRMWKEQGTPFWTRFVITFRSVCVKHGVIKQMNIDSPKFQNLIDQAFIFINEQFVYGNEKLARNFIEDIARLAQHQDKLPALDSKSFAKDPFYARDTRELFRQFFGKPDQRSSYLKVYILCPVFLRFGGSVSRCLIRWVDAPLLEDPSDDSYWTKPQDEVDTSVGAFCDENTMCPKCLDDSGTRFFKEKINGSPKGPLFLEFWKLGDPRFNDSENPLFGPHLNPSEDWREQLTIERFRNFLQFAKLKYTQEHEHCKDCKVLKPKKQEVVHVCGKNKRKKKLTKQEDLIKDLRVVRDKINELEVLDCISKEEYNRRFIDIIEQNPKVMEALQEVESNEKKGDIRKEQKTKPDPNKGKAKPVFSCDAKMTDDFHCSFLSHGDISSLKDTVAGFKVIKIEDERNGLYEVDISAAPTKTGDESNDQSKKIEIDYQELNDLLLTTAVIRKTLDGLPRRFEWWEGCGFCVAVIDYADEEKEFVHKWTNFTLKVEGYKEKVIKQIMISLLYYVARRKKRTCYGWTMGVDDVVACILPEKESDLEDINITIQQGFNFEDRLTNDQRRSLKYHQPHYRITLVLMGLEAGEAPEILKEEIGTAKLKIMFNAISQLELYGNEFVSELMNKLRDAEKNDLKRADVLWDSFVAHPDEFEIFCLVDKKSESFLWRTGMKTVDIRYFLSYKNPTVYICPICKKIGRDCYCNTNEDHVTPEAMELVDLSRYEKMKCHDQDIPELKGEDLNSRLVNHDNTEKENEKKSKAKAKKTKKEKKIESKKMDKKIHKADAVTDKSLSTRQETGRLGKLSTNTDKDSMAPSSVDQNIQTITVTLGAESKVEHINEENCQIKQHTHAENKMTNDKKGVAKEKCCKVKDLNGKGGDSSDRSKTPHFKEQQPELGALYLGGNLESVNTLEATKLQKHDGKAFKTQQFESLPEQEKKKDDKGNFTTEKELLKTTKGKNKTKKGGQGKKKKLDSVDDIDMAGNVNNNCKRFVKQLQGDTLVLSSKPIDVELSQELSIITQGMPNCSVLVVNNENSSQLNTVDRSVLQEMLEQGMDEMTHHLKAAIDCLDCQTDVVKKEDASGKSSALKICSNCLKKEPSRKVFKKCQKCKEEEVERTRYYCSRDCQLTDWKMRHKQEHKNNKM